MNMISTHYGYSFPTGTKDDNNSDTRLFRKSSTQPSNAGYDRRDYSSVANSYDTASQLAGFGTVGLLPSVIKKLATKAGTSEVIAGEIGAAQAAAPETLGLSEIAMLAGIAGTYALHLLSKKYTQKAAAVRSYNDLVYDKLNQEYNSALYNQQQLQNVGVAGTLGSVGVRMPNIKATPPPTEPE